ncbi:MAG: isocitrate/isopropylmalate dehydrogenase family protein [Chloroflexota bacterium]|nr:MAG: isocitrate/isopropylmalate dehydrogenase family protein [Chloroflexota bacterium]
MTGPQNSSICLVPGDGIGREVIPAAAEVLAGLGLGLRFIEAQAGFEHFMKTGNAIPDETLADIEAAGVALFGATSSPSAVVAGYRSPILVMRKAFDLYANLRPVYSLPGPFSSPGIDVLIVRENTEGLYAGRERREAGGITIAERIITEKGSDRIARVAFDHAQKRAAGRDLPAEVTIVHKANVLKLTDGLFRECCLRVASEYPTVRVREMLVDAMAMRLVHDAARFDVLVTTNLFGDILSDEASALVGGLGVAPSENLGEKVAVFEPVHGSAPDIAGQGIANPTGAILSAAMLLEHMGHCQAAQRVRDAVLAALNAGVLTPDLGGRALTAEFTHKVIQELGSSVHA